MSHDQLFYGKQKTFLRLIVKIVVRFTLRLYQIENLFNSLTADEIREIRTISSFTAAALSLGILLSPAKQTEPFP